MKKGGGNPKQTGSGKKRDTQYQRKAWESSGLAMINKVVPGAPVQIMAKQTTST